MFTFCVVTVLLLGGPSDSNAGKHELELEGARVALNIPKHPLVTVETQQKHWLFFSVQAGADNPYSNVPAELILNLSKGTLENVLEQSKQSKGIGTSREIGREIKRPGQVIWLLKDNDPSATHRAIQFQAAEGAVLIIDASSTSGPEMPAQIRKDVNSLFLPSLKSIKMNDKPVIAKELLQYVELK